MASAVGQVYHLFEGESLDHQVDASWLTDFKRGFTKLICENHWLNWNNGNKTKWQREWTAYNCHSTSIRKIHVLVYTVIQNHSRSYAFYPSSLLITGFWSINVCMQIYVHLFKLRVRILNFLEFKYIAHISAITIYACEGGNITPEGAVWYQYTIIPGSSIPVYQSNMPQHPTPRQV